MATVKLSLSITGVKINETVVDDFNFQIAAENSKEEMLAVLEFIPTYISRIVALIDPVSEAGDESC